MKRDLLTSSEQLAFPKLSFAIDLVLDPVRHKRVTPNMLKALALQESGGRMYFDCTGCGSAEKAAKRAGTLLGIHWQECLRVATPTIANEHGQICKFEIDPQAVGAALYFAGGGHDQDKYRFAMACRFGIWMASMLEYLPAINPNEWGARFETFISTEHVQAREAAERLARAFDSMEEVNTLLGFTRFRKGEGCQRFDSYGAAVEAIYRRLVRATGEC